MNHNVLVTGRDRIAPKDLRTLAHVAEVHTINDLRPSVNELKHALQGCDAYLLGGDEIATADIVDNAESLKVISCLAVGANHFVDINAATRRGITITNTPGMLAMSSALAELTIGHIIALRRKIVCYNNQQKRGLRAPVMTPRLSGSTVGIIGMGKAGQSTARILVQGFGAEVIYAAPRSKAEIERELGIKRVPLEILLTTSDIVVLLCALTEETTGLIGPREIALMKSTAVLINTASGPLVHGPAMLHALQAGQIAGASIDDYNGHESPIVKDGQVINLTPEIFNLDDEILLTTPYIGSLTRDSWDEMSGSATSSLMHYFQFGEAKNIVNPEFRLFDQRRKT